MPTEVKTTLKALAEAMDCQMQEYSAYLNVETGEIVEVSDEDLGKVEMGEQPDLVENEDLLREIIERPEVYRALPSQYDIHEYTISCGTSPAPRTAACAMICCTPSAGAALSGISRTRSIAMAWPSGGMPSRRRS